VDETIQACRDQSPKECAEGGPGGPPAHSGEERPAGIWRKLLADRVKRQTEEERAGRVCASRRARPSPAASMRMRFTFWKAARRKASPPKRLVRCWSLRVAKRRSIASEALMRSRAAQAQALIDASAYDEAIAFLEGALNESDDKAPALSFTIRQWRAARPLAKQVEAGVGKCREADAGRKACRGHSAS